MDIGNPSIQVLKPNRMTINEALNFGGMVSTRAHDLQKVLDLLKDFHPGSPFLARFLEGCANWTDQILDGRKKEEGQITEGL